MKLPAIYAKSKHFTAEKLKMTEMEGPEEILKLRKFSGLFDRVMGKFYLAELRSKVL